MELLLILANFPSSLFRVGKLSFDVLTLVRQSVCRYIKKIKNQKILSAIQFFSPAKKCRVSVLVADTIFCLVKKLVSPF